MSKINTQPFKDASSRYASELKALIESCPNEMNDEDFLKEFLRWRSVARRIDAERRLRNEKT